MTFTSGIALLRGINVGRAKRIAMADLRTLFEELGFTDVRTVLNSGNVVFGSAKRKPAAAAAAIEEALVQRLGVASRVTVLSSDELAVVIGGNPLVALSTDHARLLAFILSGADQRKLLEPLAQQDWAPGALAIGERRTRRLHMVSHGRARQRRRCGRLQAARRCDHLAQLERAVQAAGAVHGHELVS
jgi:uncharacterized protein (DUF1697 family)